MFKVSVYNYHNTNPSKDLYSESIRCKIEQKKVYSLFGIPLFVKVFYEGCISIVSNFSITVTNIYQLSLFLAFFLMNIAQSDWLLLASNFHLMKFTNKSPSIYF